MSVALCIENGYLAFYTIMMRLMAEVPPHHIFAGALSDLGLLCQALYCVGDVDANRIRITWRRLLTFRTLPCQTSAAWILTS